MQAVSECPWLGVDIHIGTPKIVVEFREESIAVIKISLAKFRSGVTHKQKEK